MRIEAEEGTGLAISYDASSRGLLIASAASLEPGDTITVTFSVPPSAGDERTVTGKVVRVSPNDADPEGMWPNRLAVEFDEPVPGLDKVLKATTQEE
jgi:hypothetical protein